MNNDVNLNPLKDFQDMGLDKVASDKNDSFIYKYCPKTLDTFVGNKPIIESIISWLEEPQDPKLNNVMIVYGPTGIGKTLLLKLLEKRFCDSYRLIENSDQDNFIDLIDMPVENSVYKCFVQEKKSVFRGWLIDDLGCHRSYKTLLEDICKLCKEKNKKALLTCDIKLVKKMSKTTNVDVMYLNRVSSDEISQIVKKISLGERKRVPSDFLKRIYNQTNGDIRATIQSLEVLLVTKTTSVSKNRESNTMARDQNLMLNDILKSIFSEKVPFVDKIRLGGSDTYSTAYTIHENYIERLKEDDNFYENSSKIMEYFSLMDEFGNNLDNVEYECIFGVAIPGVLLSLVGKKDIEQGYRPYKIISSSNQSIISKNKIVHARNWLYPAKNIPDCEMVDIAKLHIMKGEYVNELRWFGGRFVNKKKKVKKVKCKETHFQ